MYWKLFVYESLLYALWLLEECSLSHWHHSKIPAKHTIRACISQLLASLFLMYIMEVFDLFLNLTCLSLQVGAHIYAKAAFIVFLIVTTVLVSVFMSFFIVEPIVVILPDTSSLNSTSLSTANYSGFQLNTLEGNLLRKRFRLHLDVFIGFWLTIFKNVGPFIMTHSLYY